MGQLRIVSDSSIDMPDGWREEYEIDVLPINIQMGDTSYRQGIDINGPLFYKLVRESRVFPRTSLPSPNQVIDFYRKIAKIGDTILSIHVASRMSGTFNVVKLAAGELAKEFHIIPYDSENGSAGLAFMCKEARLVQMAGGSVQDVVDRLDRIRKQITIVLALDTLEFARRSGRVSMLQEKLATILQVKPIIMLRDGMLDIADKVRTRKKAMDRIVDLVRLRLGDQPLNIAVVHAEDIEAARELIQRVKAYLKVKEIILTDLSISVAANLGPGTVGIVAYPVEER